MKEFKSNFELKSSRKKDIFGHRIYTSHKILTNLIVSAWIVTVKHISVIFLFAADAA